NAGGYATPPDGRLDFTIGHFDPIQGTFSGQHNQQVRVDIMDPNASFQDVGTGVIMNLFQTDGSQKAVQTIQFNHTLTPAEWNALAGRKVRFRVAAANNSGKLIVGVDNVAMTATFRDNGAPILSGLQLRDPNYLAAPNNTAQSVDPTITGRVGDTYGGPG